MLQSYASTSILFLRGCFPEDCDSIEDLFDARILDATLDDEAYDMKKVMYDSIPHKFVEFKSWPRTTNLLCWTCDSSFHNIPIFIPCSIEPSAAGIANDEKKTVIGSMDVLGNFCSWNCAAAYINTTFKGTDKWERHEFLKILYKRFTQEGITEIVPSEPKTVMEQYGGFKTRQEYREKLEAANDKYETALQHNSMEHIKK
jgi:hypothetical protein